MFNVISEPGLYALILRSNKPEAEAFFRWVRHEVLPAIREHGAQVVRGEDTSHQQSRRGINGLISRNSS